MKKHRSLIISYFNKQTKGCLISTSGSALARHLGISRETVSRWFYKGDVYSDDKIFVFIVDKQDVIKGLGRGNPDKLVRREIVTPEVNGHISTTQKATLSTVQRQDMSFLDGFPDPIDSIFVKNTKSQAEKLKELKGMDGIVKDNSAILVPKKKDAEELKVFRNPPIDDLPF